MIKLTMEKGRLTLDGDEKEIAELSESLIKNKLAMDGGPGSGNFGHGGRPGEVGGSGGGSGSIGPGGKGSGVERKRQYPVTRPEGGVVKGH